MKNTIFLMPCAIILASCTDSFNQANEKFNTLFDNGLYEQAGDKMAAATVMNKDANNLYLGGLQCGNGYLWADAPEQAEQCFTASDNVLSGENEDDSSYTIKSYEKIMSKTYQGINAINQQDKFAKQLFNQAYEYQKDNISDNGSEIEKLREKFAKDQEKLQESGVSNMPSIDSLVAEIESLPIDPENSVAPMKDFANPYTTWLMALYDGAHGDTANANNGMKRVTEFAPNNKFIESDIKGLEKGSVYVVFENGKVGPIKARSLVPDSLKALTKPLMAIGVDAGIELTIPDLFPGTKALNRLTISTNKEQVNTQFLASMDSIVKTDLDKYKTSNIMKSVSFEVGKIAAATVAGIAAYRASKGSAFQDIITFAAVAAVMSIEMPWDLRSWDSIPNEIQTARVSMPANREILVNNNFSVEIPQEAKNAIVFIRIPTTNAVPGIIVGTLN